MNVVAFVLTVAVLCTPLSIFAISGGMMERYNRVGLFAAPFRNANNLNGPRIWLLFLRNFMLHFGPNYLFLHGDANLRHNSGFSGELSWFDTAALALGVIFLLVKLVFSREKLRLNRVVVFCLAGFILGVLPAAVTWDGIPHSLRSAASWPFAALLTGWIVATIEQQWNWTAMVLPTVAAAFAVAFLG
jgi:hypothetical protein